MGEDVSFELARLEAAACIAALPGLYWLDQTKSFSLVVITGAGLNIYNIINGGR